MKRGLVWMTGPLALPLLSACNSPQQQVAPVIVVPPPDNGISTVLIVFLVLASLAAVVFLLLWVLERNRRLATENTLAQLVGLPHLAIAPVVRQSQGAVSAEVLARLAIDRGHDG